MSFVHSCFRVHIPLGMTYSQGSAQCKLSAARVDTLANRNIKCGGGIWAWDCTVTCTGHIWVLYDFLVLVLFFSRDYLFFFQDKGTAPAKIGWSKICKDCPCFVSNGRVCEKVKDKEKKKG